ncbi:hypothetical protein BDR04DRAFT_1201971, partial [Suillus decipiens]
KGYFIDFDHAKFLDADGQADKSPRGNFTGNHTIYILPRSPPNGRWSFGPKGALAPRPDEENSRRDAVRRWGIAYERLTRDCLATSSMWKREFIHGLTDPPLVTSYFTPCCVLLDEWRQAISFASTQSTAISHDNICDILTRELSSISQQLAQIPRPALPSTLVAKEIDLEVITHKESSRP